MTEKKFKFIDLCAGVGAAHYAFNLLGGECIGLSEIDPLAERTYRYLHGDYQNYGDLMEIEASRLPAFDGLLAGFPCQSFSVVGKREGLIDPRGRVIYGITNILKQAKPKFFLLENVKGLLSIDSGRTFNFIIELLSSAGYKTFSKVLNSMYYGVPHSRERIYVVGFRNNLYIQEFDFPKPSPIKNIRGKRYKFQRTSLVGNDCWGYCTDPSFSNGIIKVHSQLTGDQELEFIIHEMIHACFWDLDESVVREVGHDLSKALWRMGYRRES